MVDGDVWNYVWAHEKKNQEKWIKKIPLKAIPEKAWQELWGRECVKRAQFLLYCLLGMVIIFSAKRLQIWQVGSGDQVL